MNTHKELMQVAHELADERNALAPVVAGFAGSWRGQIEARDRLIEQLGEALEALRNSGRWVADAWVPSELAEGKADAAQKNYREWKEANDGHQG